MRWAWGSKTRGHCLEMFNLAFQHLLYKTSDYDGHQEVLFSGRQQVLVKAVF